MIYFFPLLFHFSLSKLPNTRTNDGFIQWMVSEEWWVWLCIKTCCDERRNFLLQCQYQRRFTWCHSPVTACQSKYSLLLFSCFVFSFFNFLMYVWLLYSENWHSAFGFDGAGDSSTIGFFFLSLMFEYRLLKNSHAWSFFYF